MVKNISKIYIFILYIFFHLYSYIFIITFYQVACIRILLSILNGFVKNKIFNFVHIKKRFSSVHNSSRNYLLLLLVLILYSLILVSTTATPSLSPTSSCSSINPSCQTTTMPTQRPSIYTTTLLSIAPTVGNTLYSSGQILFINMFMIKVIIYGIIFVYHYVLKLNI